MSGLADKIKKKCSGIRPKTHRRAVTLDLLVAEYCDRNGENKADLLKNMSPADLRRICFDVSEFNKKTNSWLFGLSNRSLKDYIKTLRYFNDL